MRPSRLAPLALFLVACKPPVEAPEDLGELARFLFQHFDAEDGEELIVGTEGLEDWLDGLDLEGDADDRTVTPPKLTPEYLESIEGSDADPDEQVPITMGGISPHDIDAHVALVEEDNRVCIDPANTVYAARTFLTPVDCYLDGSCDQVSTEHEIRRETFLADVWYDYYKDYRRITLDDGREVQYSRGWTEKVWPADGGNQSWDQIYALDVWIPDGEGNTLRFYTLWSSVTLTGVGDNVYVNLVKSSIEESFENADAFIAGEDCDLDRDRPYDRDA